jgi:hypothetical protein
MANIERGNSKPHRRSRQTIDNRDLEILDRWAAEALSPDYRLVQSAGTADHYSAFWTCYANDPGGTGDLPESTSPPRDGEVATTSLSHITADQFRVWMDGWPDA